MDRLFERNSAPLREAPHQGGQHVGGPIALGKDFAARLDLRGEAFGVEQGEGVVDAERRQRRMEEASSRTEGGNDAGIVRRLRDVAAGAAGHEDLHARAAIFFQQERPPPALRGAQRRDQSGGSGPDDHDIPGCCGAGLGHLGRRFSWKEGRYSMAADTGVPVVLDSPERYSKVQANGFVQNRPAAEP